MLCYRSKFSHVFLKEFRKKSIYIYWYIILFLCWIICHNRRSGFAQRWTMSSKHLMRTHCCRSEATRYNHEKWNCGGWRDSKPLTSPRWYSMVSIPHYHLPWPTSGVFITCTTSGVYDVDQFFTTICYTLYCIFQIWNFKLFMKRLSILHRVCAI
jgi:hypothetical protein